MRNPNNRLTWLEHYFWHTVHFPLDLVRIMDYIIHHLDFVCNPYYFLDGGHYVPFSLWTLSLQASGEQCYHP